MTQRSSRAARLAFALVLVGVSILGRSLAAQTVGSVPVAPTEGKTHGLPERFNVHGFSVALVLGDLQGGATPDTLPSGARKALADMREFLPYKSYRLLDTQWILCCGGTKVVQPIVSGRLRGVDDQQYAFSVEVMGWAGSKLSLRFTLRDVTEPMLKKSLNTKIADDAAAYQSIKRDEADLERQLAELRKTYNGLHPTVQQAEWKLQQVKLLTEELRLSQAPLKGVAAVIDSTFLMEVGETVVIGTSSVKGDKALIALLTAATRPGINR